MALVRSDPFRDVDRVFQQMVSGARDGLRQMAIPMDAFRNGESFLIQLDLPGVSADSVELTVEDNVLTVRAERPAPARSEDVDVLIAERPYGTFTRQVVLGSSLDTQHIEAQYEAGVLTVIIPVAAHAKARRIQVTDRNDRELINA
jgi:HSP20 family protein